MILTTTEISEVIADFLSKHSNSLECKLYEYDEKVRREGELSQKICIVKEGVFRLGKTDKISQINTTIEFFFQSDIYLPMSLSFPEFPAMFEIKSIENSFSKINSMYEIDVTQWNLFCEKDKKLKLLYLSYIYNFHHHFLNTLIMCRQNRKVKDLLLNMYDTKHPILNSGISEKYIAEYLGTTTNRVKQILYER